MLGMVLAGQGKLEFPWVIVSAGCGFFLGYATDFVIGSHGWYHLIRLCGLEGPVIRTRDRIATSHACSYVLLFWHPHSGVLAATAAGCLRLPARRFLSLTVLAVLFWTSVWGTLCFCFGRSVLKLLNNGALVVSAIVIGLVILAATRRKTKRQ